ncbi:MAG: U32 family peptidase [Victivallales bacterium]|nr:U32 family peptidase [Victivallales bacterium]
MKNKPELLAPAGSFESLSSAVRAGADSIYFGAGNLNMRSRSSFNFSLNDIKRVAKICRRCNVKSYLTLNTIIYDEEIAEAKQILISAREAGIDAVIASDIAVIEMAHKLKLSVHISVQANVCSTESVRYYSKYADVIVLARELNLHQIKKITDNIKNEHIVGPAGSPVKIEIFTHGALCVSVSGKCYMSLATFNKSANRGACFQNCRRPYRVIDEMSGEELMIDNKYVMSPKDICLVRHLDKLLPAGVTVFKLEGRGRAPDYVYTVTKVYREALDGISDNNYTLENIEKWEKQLKTVFNRGFWHGGYYLGKELEMWSKNSDNQASVKKKRVGIINKFFPKISVAEIDLKEEGIKTGDEALVIGPTTGTLKLSISEIRKENNIIPSASKGETVSVPVPSKVRKNDKVYLLFKDKLEL